MLSHNYVTNCGKLGIMSKILFIILGLFFVFVLPSQVLAVDCNDPNTRIFLDQSFISEGTNPKFLEFTISNPGTVNNLKGKEIIFQESHWLGLQDINSEKSSPLNGNKFIVELRDPALQSGGQHKGSLYILGQSNPICSGISYTIGATGNVCVVDQAYLNNNPIIPGGQITIKFTGKANSTFHLKPRGGGADLAPPVTTDANGGGSFDNVTFNGTNGQTINLLITGPLQSCYPSVRLSISAPPPAPPGTPPPATTTPHCSPAEVAAGKCTRAGGEPCDNADPKNPGFKTAIGCIHTNPAEFVKDLMRFVIAISGGLAFLMMLLGAFQMLTSAGNPDTLKAGQDRLTSAIIGLLFVIFATLFLQIIGFDILRIPGFGK